MIVHILCTIIIMNGSVCVRACVHAISGRGLPQREGVKGGDTVGRLGTFILPPEGKGGQRELQ